MRKTALVTGASSDIGRAVAGALAEAGYNIAAQYYQNPDRVEEVRRRAEKANVEAVCYGFDLTRPERAEEMVTRVVEKFSGIDVLVNVVGPFHYRNILEVTPEQWTDCLDTNLNICFYVSRCAIPYLKQAKGHIVNFAFSGVENIKDWHMSTGYCAAKTGIAVLTKSLAAALAPSRTRVNAICPGLIEEHNASSDEHADVCGRVPFGRPGKPEEIAKTLVWLVKDSPEYITGSMIPVSGAWEY